MSLIADSLKKAVKEKSAPKWDPSQEVNLVGKREPLKHPGLWSVFRIGLLIILPTAILAYLIATGAFNLKKPSVTQKPDLPVSIPPEEAKAPSAKPQAEEAPVLKSKVVTPEAPPSPKKIETVTKKALPSYPPKKKIGKKPEQTIEVPKETVVSLPSPVAKHEISAVPKILPKVPEPEALKVEPLEVPAIGPGEETVVLEKKTVVPEAPPAPEPVEEKKPQPEVAKIPEVPEKTSGKPILEKIPSSPNAGIPPEISVEKEEKSQALTIEVQKDKQQVASLPSPVSKPEITRTGPARQENVFQNSDFYFNRAVFFQQAKDWQKALDNYVKAEKQDPNNPDTYNNKGVIFKELGQYDRAIDEFLRAIFLNPQYAKAYNNIGVVYFMQKKYAEGARNYLKAIDLNPRNLEAFNNLAIIYKKQKDLEKARAVLNRALAMDPDHPGTNYNLAVLYEENKEITPALHYYRRFIELGRISYPALVIQVKAHVKTLKP